MVFNQLVNNNQTADSLSLIFSALADPTRRSILTRLAHRDVTVGELAKPFDMSLPAVSKHLRVLEQAGLITRRKQAQQRYCRLEAEQLQQATEWLDHYREFWTASLDNLDIYLQEVQSKSKEQKLWQLTTK